MDVLDQITRLGALVILLIGAPHRRKGPVKQWCSLIYTCLSPSFSSPPFTSLEDLVEGIPPKDTITKFFDGIDSESDNCVIWIDFRERKNSESFLRLKSQRSHRTTCHWFLSSYLRCLRNLIPDHGSATFSPPLTHPPFGFLQRRR